MVYLAADIRIEENQGRMKIFQATKTTARKILDRMGWEVKRHPPRNEDLINDYMAKGRIPWSLGFVQARNRFITEILSDQDKLELFRTNASLPNGYGVGYDERCVEYPWLFANISPNLMTILDAGSTLNHAFLLEHPSLESKKLHILTLFPETNCFWHRGVSYLYDDLRRIPMISELYDAIVCISTLEHVGYDNSVYTGDRAYQEHAENHYILAVQEMHRVLKPGGALFLTVPYGRRQDLGWSRQFDEGMLKSAINAFGPTTVEVQVSYYRYEQTGWQTSCADDCDDCEYVQWIADAWLRRQWPNPIPVEPDLAAAARAVACVRMIKGNSS